MLYITPNKLAAALDLDRQTAYRRLRNVLFITGPRAEGHFALIHVLPKLKLKERAKIEKVFESATFIETAWPAPDDAEDTVEKLEEWFDLRTRDDEFGGPAFRLAAIRRSFIEMLADSVQSSALLRSSEHLRRVLLLAPAVFRWVALGDQSELPTGREEFKSWALNWAIAHAPITQELAA